jgi:hypothetical protein
VSRSIQIILFGLLLFAHSAVARAAEDPEALIRQGIELRRAGQDARAEGYFQRAYELASTPRATAQLGLVQLAVSDYLRAEEHLTEALGSTDAWISAHRDVLKGARNIARRNLVRVELAGAPANASIIVEDAPARHLPADGVLWLDPGRPETVKIEAPGRRATILRILGAAGEGQRLVVDMPLVVPSQMEGKAITLAKAGEDDGATRHEKSTSRALRIGGLATAVLGAAAGTLGLVYYERGMSELHEYKAAVASKGAIPWNPRDDNWRSTRSRGVGLMIGGGIGLVGGVSLFLLAGRRGQAETQTSRIALIPGSDSAALLYDARF